MKLTFCSTALAAVMGLALASVPVSLQAQTPPASTTTAAPVKVKKAKPVEYSGNLTAIDTAANTVTVASTTKVLTLSIAPTTKFLKNKKTATLADFAIGDTVTGSYTTDATGKMTAYSLHKKSVTTAYAAKTAKTEATSATPAAAPVPAMAPGQ